MSIGGRRFQRASNIITTPPVSGVTVTPTSIWGAGFQNAGDKADSSISGMASGALIIGADVAGTHISTDNGDNWVKSNKNFSGNNDDRIASVRWSPTQANVVYIYSSTNAGTGSGHKIKRGTLDPSLGWVKNWSLVCNMPRGTQAGNGDEHDTPKNPGGHPRQTGRKLMAIDEANGFLYVGSIDGVYRVPIGNNTTPTRVALEGSWVTSVALDPANSSILYATTDGGFSRGVHRITNIRASASTVSYSGSGIGNFPQACVTVREGGSTVLYLANGNTDIYKWSGGSTISSGWTNITNNLNADEPDPESSTHWSGIDAIRYSGSSQTKVIVTDSRQIGGRGGSPVGWSVNGGSTWTKVTSARTDYRVNNTSGPRWWLSQKNGSLMIDKGGFDSVNPVLDPNNSSTMFVMGRSGIWRTVNNGDTWFPVVKGTSVTTAHVIRCLPSSPNKVIVGDTDWTTLQSTDGFVSPPQSRRPTAHVAWNLAVANDQSQVVLCMGARDANLHGGVYTSTDAWASDSYWTDQLTTGTWSASGSNLPELQPRCVGAALGTNGSGTNLLFAAFQGHGLYKKFGLGDGGTWTKVSMPNSTNNYNKIKCHFAWPNDRDAIWMMDPNSGVYQSTNRGSLWKKRMTMSTTDTSYGQLRHDPGSFGRFYLTTPLGVSRITNGDTDDPIITDVSGPIKRPTTLAINPNNGHIVVGEAADSPNSTRLWISRNQGASWDDITTEQWRSVGNNPRYMDWASNGKIYTALFAGYVVITGVE